MHPAMNALVVPAGNLERHPAFKLHHGHGGARLAAILPRSTGLENVVPGSSVLDAQGLGKQACEYYWLIRQQYGCLYGALPQLLSQE